MGFVVYSLLWRMQDLYNQPEDRFMNTAKGEC